MEAIGYYSDAKTARLYVVDELLRSPQGGTYEEMLQKVDEWPDDIKQRFSVIRGFMDLYETKKPEWDLMEKTIEWLVEIYAFAHGITIPSGAKESRLVKKQTRKQFIVEDQKRRGIEKRFRYVDSAYSVFGSGDYAAYKASKDKPIVIIRNKEKAIKDHKNLEDFQNKLLEEGKAQTFAFVKSNMDHLKARISIDKRYLSSEVPQELEVSIKVAGGPHFAIDGTQQALLYFIRALHNIQHHRINDAIRNLRRVITICLRYSKDEVAQKLLKEAEALLNSINKGKPVDVSFERAVNNWPDISRRAPGIPEGIVRLHLSFIHSNVHSVTIAYLEPSYKSRHRYGIARKKQRF